jgi:hypothetical protein
VGCYAIILAASHVIGTWLVENKKMDIRLVGCG